MHSVKKDALSGMKQKKPAPIASPSWGAAKWLALAIYATVPIFFGWVGATFVRLEKGAIYVWDLSVYWTQVMSIAGFLKGGGSFTKLLEAVYDSTGTSDYNFLAALPLVPFQFFGMDSRMAFIGSICLLYGGCLYLVCTWIFRMHAIAAPAFWPPLICMALFSTTGALSHPAMRGYVDLLAVTMLLTSCALWVQADKSYRARTLYFFAGVCAAFGPLLRRYYAFYLVCLCLGFGIFAIAEARAAALRGETWSKVLTSRAFFVFGICCVYLAFPTFVSLSLSMKKSVAGDYLPDISYPFRFFSVVRHFGVLPAVVYILAFLILVRDSIFKHTALLATSAASFVSFAVFLTWQSPGQHHLYLLAIGYVSVISGAAGIAYCARRQALHRWFFGAFVLASCVGAYDILVSRSEGSAIPVGLGFSVDTQKMPAWRKLLCGTASPRPLIRNDSGELQRLLTTLDRLCATDPQARIYALGSSSIFSDAVIAAALLPSPNLIFSSMNKVLPTHHLDSRDGVPNNLLAATHVVTTLPLEVHLKPDAQRCVSVAWRQFRDGRGFAKAFQQISDEFVLANGSKAMIFWRVRPSMREELLELETDLRDSGLLK